MAANLDEDDDYLTVADVAVSCGMSKMTIYRMVDAGEIPAVRVGRRLLIKASVARDILGVDIVRLPTSDTSLDPGDRTRKARRRPAFDTPLPVQLHFPSTDSRRW